MAAAVWIPRATLVLIVVVLGLQLPTLFFDDAYITFRYAAVIAAGDGFCYNPPERVLGVTTPLFTLLLAAAAFAGIDIESAALVLGLAGHALLCLAVLEAASRLAAPPGGGPDRAAGMIAAVACAVHPHLAFTAVGGMETPLYCALLVAALAAASGTMLGLAWLARPDALLALPSLVWLRARSGGGRGVARSLAAAALVVAPWLLFAVWYFGSPVPHSILAKRAIHPIEPAGILLEFGRFLLRDPILLGATPLALYAAVRHRRRPLAAAMAGFVPLYLAGYALSRVTPFPWYANPPVPFWLMLAAAGLADLAARAPALAARRAILAAGLLLPVAAGMFGIVTQTAELQESWEEWEGAYEVAARIILQDSRPGDSVYVGEVGVIGYLLPDRVIIDSSGISSPAVHRIRMGRPEEDPEWSREVIRTLEPDYISSSLSYIHIETIGQERWFTALYERVPSPLVEQEGQVIYRRRVR